MRTNNRMYLMSVCAVLAVALVGFLQWADFSGVSAQKIRIGGTNRATPEMIAYALTHETEDLATRYNIMNQLPCENLDGGLSGKSLGAGVYCASSAKLAGELTFDAAGDQAAVFIVRVAGAFDAEANSRISLLNGAQAANIHFVADSATIGAGSEFKGSILANNRVNIGSGATLKGRIQSVNNAEQARDFDAPEGGGTGTLEICKSLDASAGNDISNRIFEFTVTGAVTVGTTANPVRVPVGSCSAPFEVLAGQQTITESNTGTTVQGGTFSGGFVLNRVEVVTSNSPSTLGTVNRATRQATVNIVDGTQQQELTLRFVNQFAITGFVEICKRAALVPNSATPDPVTGMFTFTIEGVYSQNQQNPNVRTLQQFVAAVGQCTNAIAVTIATPTPTGTPRESTVRVTEIGNPGVSLESVNTVPADRLVANSLVLGSRVNADGSVTANNTGGGYVTVRVIEGTTPANETLINFVNRSNPGTVKVCKIAGPGIPVGTRFEFEVRGLASGTPTAVPGTDVIRTVVVPAGPAAQGGYCQFVEGTFVVGTQVLVTETRVLDAIPSNRSAQNGEIDETDTGSFSVVPVTSSELSVKSAASVKGKTTQNRTNSSSADPGTYQSLAMNQQRQDVAASPSALSPFVTESGRITLSTDAVGSNAGTATLRVQKPTGATVRRAFLLAATIPDNTTTISNTDISLNGSNVTFTQSVTNNLMNPMDPTLIARNYLGEVTSLVKTTLDAASAGIVNLTVTENNGKASFIDGEILAVVFDDATQTNNSVVLYFGALSPAGDTFNLNLANPIDKSLTNFALDMSLGISFSAQGFNPPQYSTVDVSTPTRAAARLTTAAGGYDDGVAVNGALITVGGVGDTNANPANPNALPDGSQRTDDELYSLANFVDNGNQTVSVTTTNPSRDDNVFFAGFFVGNNTIQPGSDTITLSPASATNPVGTSHTVTATVNNNGQPSNNRRVVFNVLSGPNAGATGSNNTNASGQATFTYTSNGQVGTDRIQACISDLVAARPDGTEGGLTCSNIVTKTWVATFPSDVCVSRIRLNGTTGFASAPATVQGITVNPNPNLTTRQAVFVVQPGVNVIEYANTICRPTTLKVCKIAGSASLLNQAFTFDIALVPPTDGNGISLFPPASTSVTVNAGAASAGGNCAIVDGSGFLGGFLNAGSTITITERARTGSVVSAITSSTSPTSTTNGISTNLTTRQAILTGALGLNGANAVNIVTFTNTATGGGTTLAASLAGSFDFDGDGKADLSTFKPSNGMWSLRQSTAGLTSVQFGNANDKTVPTDYDGDGKTDVAVYRGGVWYIQQSQAGFRALQFGEANDVPQPADFDGDGRADMAVYRPSNGIWYWLGSTSGFSGIQFGSINDKAVVGDYDGDGRADQAVFRPENGMWYINGSRSGFTAVQFGSANDRVVPADYDGDGKTDVAVYRDGTWYINGSTSGYKSLVFGNATDQPVPADYDGDGKADVAIYRGGVWHILDSGAGSQYRTVQFGSGNEQSIPSSFIR